MLQNKFNMSELSLKYFKHFCFPKIKTSLKSNPDLVVDAIIHSMDKNELQKKFKDHSNNIITADKIYVNTDFILTMKKMIGLFIVKELPNKNIYNSDMLNSDDIPSLKFDDSSSDSEIDDDDDDYNFDFFSLSFLFIFNSYMKKIFEIDFYNKDNKTIQGQLWVFTPVLKILDVKVIPPEMTFEQFKKDVVGLIDNPDTL